MLFQSVTGYCVSNSANTSGGALRVSETGSTESCDITPPPPPPGNRLEAESGTCQGTIDSDHAGFSGTGFCNTNNAVGASEEWTLNADAAGTAKLTIGYANGTTTARPMDILVNGSVVASAVPFGGTGAWTTWQTLSVNAPVNAGANSVRAVATTANGGPNLDYLDADISSSPPPPPPGDKLEAESATCQGTIDSDHTGFSGTGFCNTDNAVGAAVEWGVTADTAGPASVTLRYSNGTTTNRPMDISVNGVVVASGVAFNSTGTWDTWADATLTLPLQAGANTVRAAATTANGGPNLDYLSVG